MRYFFLFLTIPLLYTCSSTEPARPKAPLSVAADRLSYLALGDSYTIGESVNVTERYPNQLADSLALAGIYLAPVDIVAITGWTTDELDAGIDGRDDLRQNYDLVSLLIGVNNQYRGRPVDEYESEFRALLERAIDFAGGDKALVFVISIPDYAYTPFGAGQSSISAEIDVYNVVNREITEEYNISYFDITPISRTGLDKPELVADDGLHPSGAQYALWVSSFVDTVKEKLGE